MININATISLWVVALVLALWCIIHSLNVILRIPAFRQPRRIWNSPVHRHPWFTWSSALCHAAVACMKLAYLPNAAPAIGHDLPLTIIYVIGLALYYMGTASISWMWCFVVTKGDLQVYRSSGNGQLKKLKVFLYVALVVAFFFISLLFAIYADPASQNTYGAIFWVLRPTVLCLIVFGERHFALQLVQLLKSSRTNSNVAASSTSDNQRVDELISGLRVHIRSAATSSGAVFVIGMFFAFWPYCRTLGSYSTPIIAIFASYVGISLNKTLPRPRSGVSTPRSTSRPLRTLSTEKPDVATSESELSRVARTYSSGGSLFYGPGSNNAPALGGGADPPFQRVPSSGSLHRVPTGSELARLPAIPSEASTGAEPSAVSQAPQSPSADQGSVRVHSGSV